MREGKQLPSNWTAAEISDERYLKPDLDDDAVLFSLEDVDESRFGGPGSENDLESVNQELRDRVDQLEQQFSAYREQSAKAFERQLESVDETVPGSVSQPEQPVSEQVSQDRSYFSSYSTSSIHASMLKDSIRTSAYRDFIYDNKNLFAGKTVLDIGCGTGILSLFCAKAGARLVIAVDASDIIDKARAIVYANGLQDKIRCLRGKIEEVPLPPEVTQVDVIVSEWMGYALLYESMLDSVLWARDRYLDPVNGLMVPSHARIRMAPLIDSQVRDDQVGFWNDVYGFDMRSMVDPEFYSEAVVAPIAAADVPESTKAAEGAMNILELDLHTAKAADLSFHHQFEWSWPSSEDQTLDGWAIWFDIYFTRARSNAITLAGDRRTYSFSTSPHTPQTHWQQVALLAKKQESGRTAANIVGTIEYRKVQVRERSLELEVSWKIDRGSGEKSQVNGDATDPGVEEKESHQQVWLLD